MTTNTLPPIYKAPFAQEIQHAFAECKVASVTGSAGTPTNTAYLFTAGKNGALITGIHAICNGQATASALNIYVSDDGGSTMRSYDSELQTAASFSATTKMPKTVFSAYSEQTPARVEEGEMFYCAISAAHAVGIVFHVHYTNLLPTPVSP